MKNKEVKWVEINLGGSKDGLTTKEYYFKDEETQKVVKRITFDGGKTWEDIQTPYGELPFIFNSASTEGNNESKS